MRTEILCINENAFFTLKCNYTRLLFRLLEGEIFIIRFFKYFLFKFHKRSVKYILYLNYESIKKKSILWEDILHAKIVFSLFYCTLRCWYCSEISFPSSHCVMLNNLDCPQKILILNFSYYLNVNIARKISW